MIEAATRSKRATLEEYPKIPFSFFVRQVVHVNLLSVLYYIRMYIYKRVAIEREIFRQETVVND